MKADACNLDSWCGCSAAFHHKYCMDREHGTFHALLVSPIASGQPPMAPVMPLCSRAHGFVSLWYGLCWAVAYFILR